MMDIGLKIEPTGNDKKSWEIIYFSNSDYTGEPISKRIIMGFILYVLSILVSCQSKYQTRMSLSSSETEYIALPEADKDVMFVLQLLKNMKISIKHPVTSCRGYIYG